MIYQCKFQVKIDGMQGADHNALEDKIKNYYTEEGSEEDVGVAGHVSFLN